MRARLNRLRASLDSRELQESGVSFHKRTLDALEVLRNEVPSEGRPPDEFLQGCMYYITDLCQHRFVRAEQ